MLSPSLNLLTRRAAGEDTLIFPKVWLIVDGIFIWEFITTLDYEWSVIRGHRPYRWTIWIYSITRLGVLASIINNLIVLNDTSRINCQAQITLNLLCSSLGLCMGSLLLVIRVIAIWYKNKVAVATAIGLWLINASFFTYAIVRARSVWSPLVQVCASTNLEVSKPSVISLFITDFLLLLIMLAGLLRLRRRGSDTFQLGRLLWKQGIIWFFVSTVTELLQMVFFVLHLNIELDNMFLVPSLVALSISTTRLYRNLAEFSSPPESIQDTDNTPRSARSITNSRNAPFVHVSSNRMAVTVHRAYEEHPMSHTSHYSSNPRSDVQLQDSDKRHEITFDDSMDDRAEK